MWTTKVVFLAHPQLQLIDKGKTKSFLNIVVFMVPRYSVTGKHLQTLARFILAVGYNIFFLDDCFYAMVTA